MIFETFWGQAEKVKNRLSQERKLTCQGSDRSDFRHCCLLFLVPFLRPSLRGISASLDVIFYICWDPVWANFGDICGCIFKVSFDKRFGGVKTGSKNNRPRVPGGPGPHQEALS